METIVQRQAATIVEVYTLWTWFYAKELQNQSGQTKRIYELT